MNNRTMKIKRSVLTVAVLTVMLALPASAAGFGDSIIAKGVSNLVKDVTSYLVVLCPLVGGMFAVYFMIRKSGADEQDKKMWHGRAVNAIISGVGGMLVSGLISVGAGYFIS